MKQEDFTIFSNVHENFICLITGNCTRINNEYYFYVDNEKIKADNCFSNFYGHSYCEKNEVIYKNVAYEIKFISHENYKADFYLLHPQFIPFIIFVLIFLIIRSIGRFYYSKGE